MRYRGYSLKLQVCESTCVYNTSSTTSGGTSLSPNITTLPHVQDYEIFYVIHTVVYPDGNVCTPILHTPGDDLAIYGWASERW
ncbi:hypothetical protein EDD16DRAFT_1484159 [Pisolithus croceorrhizus]|nr:hypothetical protein EDD16DRAFT_1484159 [Pisolithus croceorrhizus]KAI6134285.1 hypothetical protein EV401DRAFT_1847194 [Pisolithus croceorrhizus]KAI6143568.1 hypothetical protein EDD17DRAFT_1497358 [Pisolithus thermaeus]